MSPIDRDELLRVATALMAGGPDIFVETSIKVAKRLISAVETECAVDSLRRRAIRVKPEPVAWKMLHDGAWLLSPVQTSPDDIPLYEPEDA